MKTAKLLLLALVLFSPVGFAQAQSLVYEHVATVNNVTQTGLELLEVTLDCSLINSTNISQIDFIAGTDPGNTSEIYFDGSLVFSGNIASNNLSYTSTVLDTPFNCDTGNKNLIIKATEFFTLINFGLHQPTDLEQVTLYGTLPFGSPTLYPNYALAMRLYGDLAIVPVLGCMDILATNYNALATQDDGSCVYPVVVPENGVTTMINNAQTGYSDTIGVGGNMSEDVSWVGDNFVKVIIGSALAVLLALRYWIVALVIIAVIVFFAFRIRKLNRGITSGKIKGHKSKGKKTKHPSSKKKK